MTNSFTSEWLLKRQTVQKDADGTGCTIRQVFTRRQGRKLNKTEQSALRMIRCLFPDGLVLSQALRLDFDDGTSYNPDFVVFDPFRSSLFLQPLIIEVKGGHVGKVAWSRHGIERFRRARDVFKKFFSFQMWTYNKGQWRTDHDSSTATPQAGVDPATVQHAAGDKSSSNSAPRTKRTP